MNLFAKDRPLTASGFPQLLGSNGTVVPTLSFRAKPSGSFIVQALLPEFYSGENFSFSYKEKEIKTNEELFDLLSNYRNDPEKLFIEVFGWQLKPKDFKGREFTEAQSRNGAKPSKLYTKPEDLF